MSLLLLPSDVLIIVINELEVKELVTLSETCKALKTLVYDFGWANHIRLHPRDSCSLVKSLRTWSPRAQIRYHSLSDKAWTSHKFVARPLSRPWQGKLQPLLAINPTRLVVAAGHMLYSYFFTVSTNEDVAPGLQFECSYNLAIATNVRRDITGLAFVPDGGLDRSLFVGFEHGALEKIFLPPAKYHQKDVPVGPSLRTPFNHHSGELIESLSAAGNLLLSLSANGTAGLLDFSSESPTPHMLDLEDRGWSTHLSTHSSSAYAAFGTSSDTPLVVHPITQSELSATPSAILRSKPTEDPFASAVYGITGTPPSFPWGASDQILVSGWFDGFVHVHDLRASARSTHTHGGRAPAALTPALSLADPWSFEPIYTVGCGGGASSTIAAGSARHSVVAFWDVRSPRAGWSVHAPGNDASPVYSVVLEGSRLFGATQSRPFVYDFGPGVSPETYPSLPRVPGDDGLSYKKGYKGIGFYVTRYCHPTTSVYE